LVDRRNLEKQKDIFRQLAAHQREKEQLIIVMFPTELTPPKIGETFKLGAHDCVDKPYEKSKLLTLINEQLEKTPAADLQISTKSRGQSSPSILIVEDDKDWRNKLVQYLREEKDYEIEILGDYSFAEEVLQKKHFDVIVLDLRLIDDYKDFETKNFEGMKLLEHVRERDYKTQVIIVSGYATVENIRAGFKVHKIFDFISKQHFDRIRFQETVKNAIQSQLQ